MWSTGQYYNQENEMLVSQAFTKSIPHKNKQHTKNSSIELGISHRSLSHLMQCLGLEMCQARLPHGLLEDYLDCSLQFCEVTMNEDKAMSSLTKLYDPTKRLLKLSGAGN